MPEPGCDLSLYDYHLPKELVAQQPLPNRSDARLLVLSRRSGSLEHRHVRDLPELLRPGDCLVLNNTKVIPARLVGYRERTGGFWEGLFLEQDPHGLWRLMCRTRGKLTPGEQVVLRDLQGQEWLRLELVCRLDDGTWAARPDRDEPALRLLEQVGRVPLPPYIRRGQMLPSDVERYQTVYAQQAGSVAAPTAGLHFTRQLLDQLQQQGVGIHYVTLHVGPGTFRPIKTQDIRQHTMHAEWGQITPEVVRALQQARAAGGRVVAVGTTSVRVLETAALEGTLQPWEGWTRLYIYPGFEFRAVDALMTNFHLPRSSLLVLVSAFAGRERVLAAYEEAVREQYRFYSYGDAMLIL